MIHVDRDRPTTWVWVCLSCLRASVSTATQRLTQILIYQHRISNNTSSAQGTYFIAKEVWQ